MGEKKLGWFREFPLLLFSLIHHADQLSLPLSADSSFANSR